MTPLQVIGTGVLLAVTFALGYAAGFRSGLASVPPPRIASLKPGARRKPPLRMTKRGPR